MRAVSSHLSFFVCLKMPVSHNVPTFFTRDHSQRRSGVKRSVILWLDAVDRDVGTELSREIVSSDTSQFQTQFLKGNAKGIKTYLLAMMPEQALIVAR
jgi:hypothetical protein